LNQPTKSCFTSLNGDTYYINVALWVLNKQMNQCHMHIIHCQQN